MNTAKEEVQLLLKQLPDECSIEDVQYHLYVAEKIKQGIKRAEIEGTISQDEVENKFSQWLSV